MAKSARSTIATTFAPDVMDAIRRFHEASMPEATLQAAVQELVIVGLSRSAEAGIESALRRKVSREVRRWAFDQLGTSLREMLSKVDETATALMNEGIDDDSTLR